MWGLGAPVVKTVAARCDRSDDAGVRVGGRHQRRGGHHDSRGRCRVDSEVWTRRWVLAARHGARRTADERRDKTGSMPAWDRQAAVPAE